MTAAVHASATTVCTVALLIVVYGRGAWALTARIVLRCLPGIALCAIFPLLVWAVGRPRGVAPALGLAVLGAALYLGLALWLWPPLKSLRTRIRKSADGQ
jgi:hypothetical protein